jgi:hypothetical protein
MKFRTAGRLSKQRFFLNMHTWGELLIVVSSTKAAVKSMEILGCCAINALERYKNQLPNRISGDSLKI